jgi:hypothetical protein
VQVPSLELDQMRDQVGRRLPGLGGERADAADQGVVGELGQRSGIGMDD